MRALRFLFLLPFCFAGASADYFPPCSRLLEAATGISQPKFNDLREIDSTLLSHVQPPQDDATGANNRGLYWAMYLDTVVFIKVPLGVRPQQFFEKEVLWTKWLSDHKIGPEFFGYTKIEGNYAIVTQLFRGDHIGSTRQLQNHAQVVGPDTLKDLLNIRQIFEDDEIIANDFQFRLSSSGQVSVVDPGLYLWRGNGAEAKIRLGPTKLDQFIEEAQAILLQKEKQLTFSHLPASQSLAR